MTPTLAVREKAMQLLAADAATLAPAANANKIALVMAAFAAGEGLVIGDLTFATFDGATPLNCGLNAQPEGLDPATGDSIVMLLAPAGGWRWETTGVTNLPQTIFGFALLDNGLAVLLGAERLATSITLNAVNQPVSLGDITLRQLAGSIS